VISENGNAVRIAQKPLKSPASSPTANTPTAPAA
jgi:hypothetical protein